MEQVNHLIPLGVFLGIYIVFVLGFMIYSNMTKEKPRLVKKDRKSFIILMCILVAAFIFKCIISMNKEGFSVDVGCFTGWSKNSFGDFLHFYRADAFCDYPPFYIYVLWICGFLMKIGIPEILAIKLPTLMAEFFIGYYVYKVCEERFGRAQSLVFVALAILNPLNILDTAIWGQMDLFLSFVLVVYLLELINKRYLSATFLLALGVLVKPQALFLSPLLLFAVIKNKSFFTFLKCGGVGLLTVYLTIFPFDKSKYLEGVTGILNLPIIRDFYWLLQLYLGTAQGYDYISLNAGNFYSLIGQNLVKDTEPFIGISYATFGIIITGLVMVLSAVLFFKSKRKSHIWLNAAFLFSGIFCFAPRMHERYMVPIIIILLFAWLFNKDWKTGTLMLLFTLTNYINVEIVLVKQLVDKYPHIHNDLPLFNFISFLNIVGFLCIGAILVYEIFVLGGKKKNV